MVAIFIFLLTVLVLVVIFTLQNSYDMSITLLFWNLDNVKPGHLVLAALITGVLISVIFFLPREWKFKQEVRRLRNILDLEADELMGKTETDFTDNHPEGIKLEDNGRNSFFNE